MGLRCGLGSLVLVLLDSLILTVEPSQSSSTSGVSSRVQVHGTTVRTGVFGSGFGSGAGAGVLFLRLLNGDLLLLVLLPLLGVSPPLEQVQDPLGRASVVTANTATKRAKQITTRILIQLDLRFNLVNKLN